MRKIQILFIVLSVFLFLFTADAATNCDLQPKPALDCPPGYSVMCIPVGGDHWGCGKESNTGQIIEADPVATATTIESQLKTSPVSARDTIETVYGVVGKSFVLDGTKSVDDGAIHTFLWKQVGGPSVPISNATAATASFVPKTAGTYVFELVVTDNAGLSSVVAKREYIVQHNESDLEFIRRETATPTSTWPSGDPDFDLKTAPTSTPPKGDPDFDQLVAIDLSGDALKEFHARMSTADQMAEVNVRGWDPKKKEEILASPENLKTPEDLQVYVEAVALNDVAIKGIKIKENLIEVESREPGKLFWVIPVEMTSRVIVKYDVQDSTEDTVKVKFPWWHIFVKKYGNGPSGTQKEIIAGLREKWFRIDNNTEPQLQAEINRVSQALQIVSNIMKTKHDTAKNTISNIR